MGVYMQGTFIVMTKEYCNFCLLFKYTLIFARSNFIIIIARLPPKILFYQISLLLALQLSSNISTHLFCTTGSQCSEKRKIGFHEKLFSPAEIWYKNYFPSAVRHEILLCKYRICCTLFPCILVKKEKKPNQTQMKFLRSHLTRK